MKIRITHLDGKLPNLALMKLSAWHKAKGDEVHFTKSIQKELWETEYDLVYGSSIFSWSKPARDLFLANFPSAIIGGTGSGKTQTIEEITGSDFDEYDYSIYPHFKQSIGFSQRGCRLKCSFCVVPTKEGKIRDNSTIFRIWRGEPYPKQIILLDNDFFGQPDWKRKTEEILENDFEVSFNQGINVRLIHKEGAEQLAKLKYRDDQFKNKRIYTAWDNRKDEGIFMRGINTLFDAGIKPSHIMVYFLCGYWPGEKFEDVYYRFEKMDALGLLPYPMVYNNHNLELKKFQRWVIRRYYKFIPWAEYSTGGDSYSKKHKEQLGLFA